MNTIDTSGQVQTFSARPGGQPAPEPAGPSQPALAHAAPPHGDEGDTVRISEAALAKARRADAPGEAGDEPRQRDLMKRIGNALKRVETKEDLKKLLSHLPDPVVNRLREIVANRIRVMHEQAEPSDKPRSEPAAQPHRTPGADDQLGRFVQDLPEQSLHRLRALLAHEA